MIHHPSISNARSEFQVNCIFWACIFLTGVADIVEVCVSVMIQGHEKKVLKSFYFSKKDFNSIYHITIPRARVSTSCSSHRLLDGTQVGV
jgi:hypothetical protein